MFLNQIIASVRIEVEHVIAGIKRCRILKETLRVTKDGISDMVMEIRVWVAQPPCQSASSPIRFRSAQACLMPIMSIEKSEQAGVSLYLETETEANVSMYEHFGFTVIKKIKLPIIDLPMWEMVKTVEK